MLKKSANKAAGENKPEAYRFSPTRPEPAGTGSLPELGYVEDFFEPRTKLGKERVLARLGRVGVKEGFFSIPPC